MTSPPVLDARGYSAVVAFLVLDAGAGGDLFSDALTVFETT
jgi:hypothetical protein